MNMTLFDYAVLAIIGVSILVGVWRGVVSELLALAAWVVAFVAAQEFASAAVPWLAKWISDPGLRIAAAYVGIFIAVLLSFALLRILVSLVLSAVGLALADRLLGACFGAIRGGVIVVLLVMLAGVTPLPEKAFWRDATFAPPLETIVIAGKRWMPTELATRVKFHR
ncbi:MAG: CvpA family protein [Rhodocyclaceae bacterium]|nr:CvpA family protein [Rhodocyclaceae bacterium]